MPTSVEMDEFFKACRSGDQVTVKRFLDGGFDPELKPANSQYDTALMIASAAPSDGAGIIIVEKLKEKYRQDPRRLVSALSATDYNGNSAFSIARKRGNTLLSSQIEATINDAKISFKDIEHLLMACRNGALDIVERHFSAGNDPDARSASGKDSPLTAAASSSNEDVGVYVIDKLIEKYRTEPRRLLNALTITDSNYDSPLEIARKRRNSALVQKINETISDTKVALKDPDHFLQACRSGAMPVMQQHITNGMDVDYRSQNGKDSPMLAAASSPNEDAGIFILDKLKEKYQGNPRQLFNALTLQNTDWDAPIEVAKKRRHTLLIQQLTQAISDSKVALKDPDHFLQACRTGNQSVVQQHLSNGMDSDYRVQSGKDSPILSAAASPNEDTGILILEQLKDKYKTEPRKLIAALTIQNADWDAPIEVAKKRRHTLLANNISQAINDAKVAISDPEHFLQACRTGNLSVVQQHLTKGMDPDTRASSGKDSALISAASSSNEDVGILILEKLQDKYQNDSRKLLDAISIKNSDFDSAQDIAKKRRHTTLASQIGQIASQLQPGNNNAGTQSPKSTPQNTPAAKAKNIPVVIPRSDAPPPIKLDKTVTPAKLQQTKDSGKTNLQILAEQGQLGDVFTSEIWIGRREELDQAWEAVPEQFRNQVNIDVIRGKLSQATIMDRFGIDKNKGWEQGF